MPNRNMDIITLFVANPQKQKFCLCVFILFFAPQFFLKKEKANFVFGARRACEARVARWSCKSYHFPFLAYT